MALLMWKNEYFVYINLAIRVMQFNCSLIAMCLFGGGFNGQQRIFTDKNGDVVDITVFLGGPTVNFVLLMTFAASIFSGTWIVFVHFKGLLRVPSEFLLGTDSIFSVLLLSGGCAISASDYMRYCDVLQSEVNCSTLKTGAIFCLLAFVMFLTSLGWGVWLRREERLEEVQNEKKSIAFGSDPEIEEPRSTTNASGDYLEHLQQKKQHTPTSPRSHC
jgi:hypothetical protein